MFSHAYSCNWFSEQQQQQVVRVMGERRKREDLLTLLWIQKPFAVTKLSHTIVRIILLCIIYIMYAPS